MKYLTHVSIAMLLWLLSTMGSSHNAVAQQPWRWECGPMHFNYQTLGKYLDESDSSLYVTGIFDTVNGVHRRYMVRMRPDGSVQSMPYVPMWARAMIRWNGKLYAGGESGNGSGLYRLDDTGWTQLGGTFASSLIYCLYPYQGKLLVGGTFDEIPGNNNTESVLKEWDGITLSTFKGLDSVLTSHGINAMTEFQGDLIVAGNLIPYAPANPLFKDILRWTGTSWQPLGNVGLPGGGLDFVSDLKVVNGELYVAGLFQEGNGSPGNGIAKWDGTQWHRLGSGTGPTTVGVNDLEMQGDTLLVGGTFRTMNGDTAWKMARYWNGIWCGNKTRYLGPDVVTRMVNYFDTVIAAGGFLDSANASSYTCGWMGKLVEWDESCFAQAIASVPATLATGDLFRIEAYPNPSTSLFEVRYEAGGTTQDAQLRVTNALGQVVMSRNVPLSHGANRFTIDLTGLPAGLYILRLSDAAGLAHTGKVVKE